MFLISIPPKIRSIIYQNGLHDSISGGRRTSPRHWDTIVPQRRAFCEPTKSKKNISHTPKETELFTWFLVVRLEIKIYKSITNSEHILAKQIRCICTTVVRTTRRWKAKQSLGLFFYTYARSHITVYFDVFRNQ